MRLLKKFLSYYGPHKLLFSLDMGASLLVALSGIVYPVVTRTRTYADCPPACLENIGFIDTPPAPAGTAKKPSGLATAVNAHQWLKVQDDAQEQPDGKWTRTQSWMGCLSSEGGWDANLYGTTDRWPMPYTSGGNS